MPNFLRNVQDNLVRGVPKSEILSYIKKNGKSDVELTEIINEDILGGMIVKIGDKQLDASVIRDIKELKKTFNKNLYIKDF